MAYFVTSSHPHDMFPPRSRRSCKCCSRNGSWNASAASPPPPVTGRCRLLWRGKGGALLDHYSWWRFLKWAFKWGDQFRMGNSPLPCLITTPIYLGYNYGEIYSFTTGAAFTIWVLECTWKIKLWLCPYFLVATGSQGTMTRVFQPRNHDSMGIFCADLVGSINGYLSICLSVCLSVYLSIYLSIPTKGDMFGFSKAWGFLGEPTGCVVSSFDIVRSWKYMPCVQPPESQSCKTWVYRWRLGWPEKNAASL